MSAIAKKTPKLGVIVGNRGFFPDHLAAEGREEIIKVLQAAGVEVVALTPEESKFGAVETFSEAKRCAELFKKHRDSLDGVVVTLPNFGDERAIADTLRLSGLNVPVLIQATPDTPNKMLISDRRDSFCGKMSACNNLMQYRIPYSLTTLHTESPSSDVIRERSAMVPGCLPRGARFAWAAHRCYRRAPAGVQYRPLQRKDSGEQRHLRHHHRSV